MIPNQNKVHKECIVPSITYGDVEFDVRLASDNQVFFDGRCYGRELHTFIPYAFTYNYKRMLEQGKLGDYWTYLQITPVSKGTGTTATNSKLAEKK